MYDRDTLPFQLAAKWGTLPNVKKRGPNEWSASCPSCGDYGHSGNDTPDRFRMFGPDEKATFWRGWCRRCGFFSSAESENDKTIPQAVKDAWEAERRRLAFDKEQAIRGIIAKISREAYWRGFHDGMTAASRQLWHQRGVGDYMIDTLSLGYTDAHTVNTEVNGESRQYQSPALVIPYLDATKDPDNPVVTNMQYRMTNPPDWASGDRYRFTKGLPPGIFRTEPDRPLDGISVLVIEGPIKAMVVLEKGLFPTLKSLSDARPTVVGVPFKTVSSAMVDELAKAGRVIIGLDPDAYERNGNERLPAAHRMAAALRKRNPRQDVRLCHFVQKPDDLILAHGRAGAEYVMGAAKGATPYRS